jgi:hypothetical protein
MQIKFLPEYFVKPIFLSSQILIHRFITASLNTTKYLAVFECTYSSRA